MPPSASSNLPRRSDVAPVNEPFSWPNSSVSISSVGIAAQFTFTNGPAANGLALWMCAASSSLPVPDSPISSTRASERAAIDACSTARCHAGLVTDHLGGRAHQFAQPLILLPQGGVLQRVLHRQQHAVAAQRLFQEIESAGARGFHRVGDGAVAGDHDGRRRRAVLLAPPQQVDAVAVGQLHVEQVGVGAPGVGVLAELRHAAADVHLLALALQNHAQRAADILFVIHDQDAFGCH